MIFRQIPNCFRTLVRKQEKISGNCLIFFPEIKVLLIYPDKPLLPKDTANVKKIVLTFDANRFSYFPVSLYGIMIFP